MDAFTFQSEEVPEVVLIPEVLDRVSGLLAGGLRVPPEVADNLARNRRCCALRHNRLIGSLARRAGLRTFSVFTCYSRGWIIKRVLK